ncbi:unnamed protein product [Adineta steineri]|uniref:Sodefrin repeats C n=1 Tax=Adineta steineri TaxID=433720 RepID=A0A814NXL0_9BILA|nr:unnamed protein product [Adineta steineri]CAF1205058.1 unnamed protein product [Adineta steineri]
MMIVQGLVLLLLLSIVPTNSLICYECGCDQSDTAACDCDTTSDITDNDYCVILEQRYVGTTYIQLSRIPRNSSWIYIEDPYYILTHESIRYNLTTSQWYLWTFIVVYGCDWDLCNAPNLINSLPNSFKYNINSIWLDLNIYGTGAVTSCHHCDTEVCGNVTNSSDFIQCQMVTCDTNITSCLTYDLWNNVATGEQCYQSQCAPEYLNGEFAESYGGKYRIDIEAVVYLAQDRSKYDIWELDVFCAVKNCTRPTIFQEVSQQLTMEIGDLSAFPPTRPLTTHASTTTTPIPDPLRCYSCDCSDASTCPCSSTVVSSLDYTYCVIIREHYGQDVWTSLRHIDQNSTRVHIQDFPYLLVRESILYDEQLIQWNTTTNSIVYGCNYDLCNHPSLIPYMSNSFQMYVQEDWLNTNVKGTGQPVRNCHECPEEPQCGTSDFLDASRCPIRECNTTCLVSDIFDKPNDDLQCYQSFCAPSDSEHFHIDTNRVDIEGLLYLNKEPYTVELWEVDIYCRADDCSRPEIFSELKSNLTVVIGDLGPLDPQTSTSSQSTNNPSTTTQSTTNPPTTTSTASLLSGDSLFISL